MIWSLTLREMLMLRLCPHFEFTKLRCENHLHSCTFVSAQSPGCTNLVYLMHLIMERKFNGIPSPVTPCLLYRG